MADKFTFESAMEQLAQVVSKLESREVSLDESIALYEKGMKLSKLCAEMLEKAEQKVRFLREEAEAQNEE